MITKKVDWSILKSNADAKGLKIQHIEYSSHYEIFAIDGALGMECTLAKDGGADQTDFETNYKAGSNKKLQEIDAMGKPVVGVMKTSGKDFESISSHDFTDRTTWYSNSSRVTGETLTANGLEYSSVNLN